MTEPNEELAAESSLEKEPTRGSLLVIFLTVFIDLLGFGMVLPLLPIYADQFTTDPAGWQIGLLMASFSAVPSAMMVGPNMPWPMVNMFGGTR